MDMISQHLLKLKGDLRAGESELEPGSFVFGTQHWEANYAHSQGSVGHGNCRVHWETGVFVMKGVCTSVLRAPFTSVERARLHGEERCADIRSHPDCLRSLAAVLSVWPSCKCGGLIKPTARHTQAHKRGWWKWGMEWALMDIGIELHWQGWRLKAWIPRQTWHLRLKQAVGSTRRLCCYYNAVCKKTFLNIMSNMAAVVCNLF